MMARTPASVTRTARRAAERGEGGRARTNASVMDQTTVSGSNSSCRPQWNNIVANFLPTRGYICVMVTGVAGVRVKLGRTREVAMSGLTAEARKAALQGLPGLAEVKGRDAIT